MKFRWRIDDIMGCGGIFLRKDAEEVIEGREKTGRENRSGSILNRLASKEEKEVN